MFQSLIQIMLLILLVYFTWNALLKKPAPPPKKEPEKKPSSGVVVINDGKVVVADGGGGSSGGSGGDKGGAKGGGPKFEPRSYLAWFGLFLIVIFILLAFTDPNNPTVIDFGSILTFPLKPLGLAIFLLLLTLMGGGIKNFGVTKEGWKQLWAAYLVLVIFSLPFVASWLAQQGEREALNIAQAAARRQEKVGAIVLLGQSTTQLNLLQPNQVQLTDASDRIFKAAQEYRKQRALGSFPAVIVSAGPRPDFVSDESKKINVVEAKDIANILVQLGVPPDAIVLDPNSLDVRSSAVAVRGMISDRVIAGNRVILVSSALNMQRARQTFAQLGIETIPSPAGFYTFQPGTVPKLLIDIAPPEPCSDTIKIYIRNLRQLRLSDFIPNADSLLISTRVVNEFWTSTYYLLRGWLASTTDAVPQPNYKC